MRHPVIRGDYVKTTFERNPKPPSHDQFDAKRIKFLTPMLVERRHYAEGDVVPIEEIPVGAIIAMERVGQIKLLRR